MNLGPYNVISEIGRGGVGVVYKAHDPLCNRTVAIKLILGSASMNRRGRIGLVREARIAGSLSHPHIVTIHDVGQHKGWLYLVMELLHGAPLSLVAQSGEQLSIGENLKFIIQLCDALDHAHGRGVIHRDIKPANTSLSVFQANKICSCGGHPIHANLSRQCFPGISNAEGGLHRHPVVCRTAANACTGFRLQK